MGTKTTIVSSYFELRETPHYVKNPHELCPSNIKYFIDLGFPLCLFVGKVKKATHELFEAWKKIYPLFRIVYLENLVVDLDAEEYNDYRSTMIYRNYKTFLEENSREIKLPVQRNIEKDSIEYLCIMHSRIEFMKLAIDLNPFGSSHFIWADFTIHQLFRKGQVTDRQFQYLANYLCGEGVFFPGCWAKISDENCLELASRIFWRFCGGVFMGRADALVELYYLYVDSFAEFFHVCGGVLTWEVNYWAWLEKVKGWHPQWYYALHTDSILNVSADAYTGKIRASLVREMELPKLGGGGVWYAGSAAYVEHEGREYLNIRYVNYWITPEGYYIMNGEGDERIIDTQNVCCVLGSELEIERSIIVCKTVYGKDGEKMAVKEREKKISKGVEDIRLFVDGSGELRFIGTTIEYSNAEMNRIIVGKYSLDEKSVVLRDAEVIEPPKESYIEKNWIPLVYREKTKYMYQWNGMEIGEIADGKLVLGSTTTSKIPEYWMFSKFRGSTIFTREFNGGREYRVGLVHYSEEHGPRHYYHVLVWLDAESLKPVWVSQVFCFMRLSIEFCIGMKSREKDYVFWISRFDREPVMMAVSKMEFDKIRV